MTTVVAHDSAPPHPSGPQRAVEVDLAAVARLVEALERDLAKVREGSGDLDMLRSEVEQLRVSLQSSANDPSELHAGLYGVRAVLHKVEHELIGEALTASDYMTRIARMLGM